MAGNAVSRRRGRVGREAYIEYLLLDRFLELSRRTGVADLVGYFRTESSTMTDAEFHAAIDRLVTVGAAHRSGDEVWASEVARHIASLPEALPEED